MSKSKKSASVSVNKGPHGNFVVQDVKNCDDEQTDVNLVLDPKGGKSYVPDFIKIKPKNKK
jgi:hypothetical protein